jgi:hypothetical protein
MLSQLTFEADGLWLGIKHGRRAGECRWPYPRMRHRLIGSAETPCLRAASATVISWASTASTSTFILRGRTLTAFVERTKGEKWKALADILGLEQVDQLRLDLQTVKNDTRAAAIAAEHECASAARSMQPTVKVAAEPEILAAVARLCTATGVPPPTTLEEVIKPEWAASLSIEAKVDSGAVRVADLATGLQTWSPDPADVQSAERWNAALASPAARDRKTNELFRAASSLLADESNVSSCPLCGQSVDDAFLRSQINVVLEDLRQSAEALEHAASQLRTVGGILQRTSEQAESFKKRAANLGIATPELPPSPHAQILAGTDKHLPVDGERIGAYASQLAAWRSEVHTAVSSAIRPAPTPRETRLVELGGTDYPGPKMARTSSGGRERTQSRRVG